MAIIIQTQQTVIPIQIGELNFTFDTSDASIEKFTDNATKILQEIEQKSNADVSKEEVKGILKRGFDFILGDGAFEKIYEQTGSLIQVTNQFMQLSDAISKELHNYGFRTPHQRKVEQYLNKNKSQQQKKKKRKK